MINIMMIVGSINHETHNFVIAVDKMGGIPQFALPDTMTIEDGCVHLLKDITGVDARHGWVTPKLACVKDVLTDSKRIITLVYNVLVPQECILANKYETNTLDVILKNNRTSSELIIQGVRNV